MISKLLRLYKRTHGLRQICNIVVYISHSASTVHLLNLPDKNAARDIVHGLKHLEEIGESWLCARRTLGILHLVAKRWSIEMPEEADKTFMRAEAKFGPFKDHETSPKIEGQLPPPTPMQPLPPSSTQRQIQSDLSHNVNPVNGVPANGFFTQTAPQASPMPAPNMAQLDGSMTMPPRSAAECTNKPSQHNYGIPQTHQQGCFNPGIVPESQPPPQPTTSPTMLFGGVDSLMRDQDWWLRDSNQMFATWNGMDHENSMNGNGGFDLGTGTAAANMKYGNANGTYGNMMNGMTSNGNMGYTR